MTGPNASVARAPWPPLRVAGITAMLLGAGGSVALMLRTSPNMPKVLVLLIGLWVVSPFALLAGAELTGKPSAAAARTTIYVLALLLAAVSLWVYWSVAYGPPRPKPAFFFVLLPPISWVLIAASAGVAALRTRKA